MAKTSLTWDRLVELEPRLGDLLAYAKSIKRKRGKSFCANAAWYGYGEDWPLGGIKDRLLVLVGYERKFTTKLRDDAPESASENSMISGARKLSDYVVVVREGVDLSPGKEVLLTSAAYDLAYDTIYAALPNCRGCMCL